MLVFRKALHPEFFGIEARKRISHGEYEFESWIYKGGHVLMFNYAGTCAAEIVTDRTDGLPDKGQVITLPCAGEKDHEEKIGDRVEFLTSMQTETLSDHLYVATYNEMLDHSRSSDSILTVWHDQSGRHNMSLVDLQRYRTEVHVQGYHLRSDCALVLRTQSIFRAVQEKAKVNTTIPSASSL